MIKKNRALPFVFLLAVYLSSPLVAQIRDKVIRVDKAFLKLDADVEVAASEAGVIQSIDVKVGSEVSNGDLLGKIDDRTKLLLRTKTQLELEISNAKAQSRTEIRKLEEKLTLSESELKRGEATKGKFDTSLSDSELDKLRFGVIEDKLDLEEARLSFNNAQLKAKLAANELKMADVILSKHRIESPLDGFVEEVFREAGEWVEPGEKIFRVIKLKKLRVEGFVSAAIPLTDLKGKQVTVVVETKGERLTHTGSIQFVSRELDPVNQQRRVWATIPNNDLTLEPGSRASMTIQATSSANR